MAPDIDELRKQVMSLPEEARADLASSLIDSLDQTVDEDVEAAWQEEIARRIDELEAGKVTTIPWAEVRRRGQELLRGKQASGK